MYWEVLKDDLTGMYCQLKRQCSGRCNVALTKKKQIHLTFHSNACVQIQKNVSLGQARPTPPGGGKPKFFLRRLWRLKKMTQGTQGTGRDYRNPPPLNRDWVGQNPGTESQLYIQYTLLYTVQSQLCVLPRLFQIAKFS